MAKDRFHGGVVETEVKKQWLKKAKEEGFQNIWSWLQWLAHNRVNGALILDPKRGSKKSNIN